jgi:hypothetical protein
VESLAKNPMESLAGNRMILQGQPERGRAMPKPSDFCRAKGCVLASFGMKVVSRDFESALFMRVLRASSRASSPWSIKAPAR